LVYNNRKKSFSDDPNNSFCKDCERFFQDPLTFQVDALSGFACCWLLGDKVIHEEISDLQDHRDYAESNNEEFKSYGNRIAGTQCLLRIAPNEKTLEYAIRLCEFAMQEEELEDFYEMKDRKGRTRCVRLIKYLFERGRAS